jgi:hypothetical protein
MNKKMDELAGELALARIAAQQIALIGSGDVSAVRLMTAFNALDNNGAFAKIDEHTGYAAPEDVIKKKIRSAAPKTDETYDAVRELRDTERGPGEGLVYGKLPNNPPGPSVADVMFGRLPR